MRLAVVICMLLKLIWSCQADTSCKICNGLSKLVLRKCTLNATAAQALKQCPSVQMLDIELVVLPTLYPSEQMKEIRVENCSTVAVEINSIGSYEINNLIVEKNYLRALPRNLKVLKKLKMLNLAFNLIECIDMAEFDGLSELEAINLSDNKIIEVCSIDSPFLPSMEWVQLQRNYLTTLNLENWKTPNIRTMYLNNNNLSIVNKLSELPKLNSLFIHNNSLNCEWWNPTYNKIKDRVMFFTQHQDECDEKAISYNESMKQIEASSKIPSPSADQCQIKASQSLEQILAQAQQLQQQVASLGTPKCSNTKDTIAQLQQTCLGQQSRLRDLVKKMDMQHQVPRTYQDKPLRKGCRCGLKAQARLFQKQLDQLAQDVLGQKLPG